jgi:cyclophilin family peptidyl-prolyl cis-trans isomerase
MPVAAATLALVAGAAASCGGGGGGSTGTSTSASLPAACHEVSEPPPKRVNLKPPPQTVSPSDHLVATVKTSCGSFTIALDARQSPKTVNSFAYLARKGVYDDTTFHRVVPQFVIQGGDPKGDGTGGPGYFVQEKPPASTSYTRGTVAMAKTQTDPPGRSGSQFFVVLPADAGLPPIYAVLGKVRKGMATVDRIASLGVPNSPTGKPREPVVIDSITVRGG